MTNYSFVVYSILFILLTLGWLSGCSRQSNNSDLADVNNLITFPVDKEADYEIRIEQDSSFSISDHTKIGRISGLEIDSAGTVYISDIILKAFHVLGRNGDYLAQIGREGFGPEEFQLNPWLTISGQNLLALDQLQSKLNIYSVKTLELEESINLTSLLTQTSFSSHIGTPYLTKMIDKDTYIVGINPPVFSDPNDERSNVLERYSPHYIVRRGESPQLLFEQQAHQYLEGSGVHYPFMGKPLMAVSEKGHIYTAWSRRFLIKKYNLNGDQIEAIYYPTDQKKIRKSEILSLFDKDDDWSRNIIQNANLPDEWPVLDSMILDDRDQIWISTFTDDISTVEWWVLQDSGELLTRFRWSTEKEVMKIKDGFIYTKESTESGLPSLSKYRFQIVRI